MLTGKKTIILAAIYALLSTFTGLTGWTVPGFTPDPNWLANDLGALMVVTGRLGLAGATQSILGVILNSMAPKIVDAIRAELTGAQKP